MSGRPIRLLILEDRPEDADLALHQLRRAGFDPSWRRVEDELGFKANLNPELDLIIADYHQPDFDALRALKLMQEAGLEIPFIIVSGAIGEDLAVSAVRLGVVDYVLKDRMARLGTAVQNALEQAKLRRRQREGQQALEPDALLRVERAFVIDGHPFEMTASIGIAVSPQDGSTAETLLRRADVAMYVAKRSGNSYTLYRPEDDPYDASRLVLRADLRRAIAQREIILYYQPQV